MNCLSDLKNFANSWPSVFSMNIYFFFSQMVRTSLETKYYYYKHSSSSHSMGYRDQENTLLLCKPSYIIKITDPQKQNSRSASMSTITEC